MQSLLGIPALFRPRSSGIPQYCDSPQKVDEKQGVKGMLPLGVWIHCSTVQAKGGRKSLVIWVAITSAYRSLVTGMNTLPASASRDFPTASQYAEFTKRRRPSRLNLTIRSCWHSTRSRYRVSGVSMPVITAFLCLCVSGLPGKRGVLISTQDHLLQNY